MGLDLPQFKCVTTHHSIDKQDSSNITESVERRCKFHAWML